MPEHAKRQYYHVMTDEEFLEYHKKRRKKALLDEMLSASSSSFSSKDARKKVTPISIKDTPPEHSNITQFQPASTDEGKLTVSDDEWDKLLAKAYEEEDMTPIQKVTDSEMSGFTLDDVKWGDDLEPDNYHKMYKKEQAMLSEVLKDVTKQAEIANGVLKQLTAGGKLKFSGGSGISKLFPDLLSAANSLNGTRRAIIKDMSDLKKSAADFELKRMKETGSEAGDDVNSAANAFFGKIVNNRKEYIDAAMAAAIESTPMPMQFGPMQHDDQYQYDDDSASDEYEDEPQHTKRRQQSFSITTPLGDYADDDDYLDTNADPYGYLRHENSDVSICVQLYGDGRLEFAAVDGNGDYVEDYELPGDDLLETMTVRPTSNYATDAEGRRYKIIRLKDPVDISDI